jgi:hypothetical protein
MSKLPQSHETEDRVRAVAHALWLQEGQPDGRADAHWLSAVEIVNAETAKPKAAPKAKAAVASAPKTRAAAATKAVPRKRG